MCGGASGTPAGGGGEGGGGQVSCHYLLSKWGPSRRVIRSAFYAAFFIFQWIGTFQARLAPTRPGPVSRAASVAVIVVVIVP